MRGAGVTLAALGLVAAVWVSLVLSQSLEGPGVDAPPAPVPDFGAVDGFRSDAWYLPDDTLLGFVEVPGGPFPMGSDSSDPLAFDIEKWPGGQRLVDVPRFYIGRYEVTVAQYAAFVSASGHRVADPEALAAPPTDPVTAVAWTDAIAYARWLDGALREGDDVPPELGRLLAEGWRVQLPTEAQWEKAARGDDGRIFPWGNEPLAGRANFGGGRTLPVGTLDCPECPYGLSDMAGNVWEWTRSPYQPYPYDEADDRDDLSADALWVMRGGSFGDPARFVRAANRGGADPGARRPFIGFRVVVSPR